MKTAEVSIGAVGSEGALVERLPDGKVRISLPDADDLGPFLATVPERLHELPPP